MENVHVCNIGISGIHGKELPGQSSFHQKYRRSRNGTDVRHILEIENRTIRRDLRSEYYLMGRFFMEVFIFGW